MRAGAGAVVFEFATVEHEPEKVEVLNHRFGSLKSNPLSLKSKVFPAGIRALAYPVSGTYCPQTLPLSIWL
jgi:hypothetical protein